MRPDAPSATALAVILSLIRNAATLALRGLVAADDVALATEIARQISPVLKSFVKVSQLRPLRQARLAGERVLLPGLSLHFSVRKFMIEKDVRQSLAEGFQQVVVLGAGYDGLAARLARETSGAEFFELDMPHNVAIKQRALTALGGVPPRLHLGPVDLGKVPLAEALQQIATFDPQLATVFVVEGVLMYLEQAHVEGLFRAIRALPCAKRRVVFTAIAKKTKVQGERIGLEHPLFVFFLKSLGEPYRWGIRPDELADFLGTVGFQLSHLYQRREFAAALSAYALKEKDLIDWELVAQADEA